VEGNLVTKNIDFCSGSVLPTYYLEIKKKRGRREGERTDAKQRQNRGRTEAEQMQNRFRIASVLL
jgi:hypothetical protein